jgi:hypothetical protein
MDPSGRDFGELASQRLGGAARAMDQLLVTVLVRTIRHKVMVTV